MPVLLTEPFFNANTEGRILLNYYIILKSGGYYAPNNKKIYNSRETILNFLEVYKKFE